MSINLSYAPETLEIVRNIFNEDPFIKEPLELCGELEEATNKAAEVFENEFFLYAKKLGDITAKELAISSTRNFIKKNYSSIIN